MVSKTNIKIWLECPSDLVDLKYALPKKDDTIEMQFNAISRFTIAIVAILAITTDVKHLGYFLLSVLIFILLVYYGLSNTKRENYTYITRQDRGPGNIGDRSRVIPPKVNPRVHTSLQRESANNRQQLDGGYCLTQPPIPTYKTRQEKVASSEAFKNLDSRKFNMGLCEENDANYIRNLHINAIQPGIYSANEASEPITSGISETPQFRGASRRIIDGDTFYTRHVDGTPLQKTPREPPSPSVLDNTYDPRGSGYGPAYRAYEDEMTGQIRYYYDDINAVKMPNVSRSNIDHHADLPGRCDNREFVEERYADNVMSHRSDIQETIMRKMNANMWQNRKFPKHTMGRKC